MAAKRARSSCSAGFYSDSNNLSTAEFFADKKRRRTSAGEYFEVERVVTSRKTRGQTKYLVRWKGYGPLSDSWEPEDNLNPESVRHFNRPNPLKEEIRKGVEAIGLGVLQHLKIKHGHTDSSTLIELRHDVFRHLFQGKGRPSARNGFIELAKDDFCRCHFPDGWDVYVDRLGDGQKVDFPVRVRCFLSWGPQTHGMINSKIKPLPRYHQEKLSICFSTSAYSLTS